jgi:hypothetical protein
VKFTLKYSGPLKSSRGGARLREKHAIRQHIHRQLEELWKTDTNRLATVELTLMRSGLRKKGDFDVERPIHGFAEFFFKHSVGGFTFVPLVNMPMEAHCRLDLRVYRRTRPGGVIFAGGDLDNRLKVFLDALRMPTDVSELKGIRPHTEGELVYCVLADDRLITGLSIESIRLLGPASSSDENYVEIDVDVTIQAITPMGGTLDLLF